MVGDRIKPKYKKIQIETYIDESYKRSYTSRKYNDFKWYAEIMDKKGEWIPLTKGYTDFVKNHAFYIYDLNDLNNFKNFGLKPETINDNDFTIKLLNNEIDIPMTIYDLQYLHLDFSPIDPSHNNVIYNIWKNYINEGLYDYKILDDFESNVLSLLNDDNVSIKNIDTSDIANDIYINKSNDRFNSFNHNNNLYNYIGMSNYNNILNNVSGDYFDPSNNLSGFPIFIVPDELNNIDTYKIKALIYDGSEIYITKLYTFENNYTEIFKEMILYYDENNKPGQFTLWDISSSTINDPSDNVSKIVYKKIKDYTDFNNKNIFTILNDSKKVPKQNIFNILDNINYISNQLHPNLISELIIDNNTKQSLYSSDIYNLVTQINSSDIEQFRTNNVFELSNVLIQMDSTSAYYSSNIHDITKYKDSNGTNIKMSIRDWNIDYHFKNLLYSISNEATWDIIRDNTYWDNYNSTISTNYITNKTLDQIDFPFTKKTIVNQHDVSNIKYSWDSTNIKELTVITYLNTNYDEKTIIDISCNGTHDLSLNNDVLSDMINELDTGITIDIVCLMWSTQNGYMWHQMGSEWEVASTTAVDDIDWHPITSRSTSTARVHLWPGFQGESFENSSFGSDFLKFGKKIKTFTIMNIHIMETNMTKYLHRRPHPSIIIR